MFESARKRKQEKQRSPLAPRADGGAASGDGEHQKMHVNGTLFQALPNLLGGEPTAGQVSQTISDDREAACTQRQPVAAETQDPAQDCRGQLRLPLIDLIG